MKRLILPAIVLCSLFLQNVSAQDATAKNKTTILAAYDALNRKDWNGFAALCDENNYRDVGVAPMPLVGTKAALEAYQQFFAGFPDLRIAVNEIAIITPTRFLLRVTLSGTNTGSLMGMPPTGKRMQYDDCDLVEFDAAGRVIYHQPTKGGPEVFRQLGIDPQTAANKQTVRQMMDLLDKHDLNGVAAAFAPGCRFHGWAPETLDVNGYKQAMSALIAAFPNARFVVHDMVAEGDKVVVRHHFEGVHSGAAFQGVPTSGKNAFAPATVTLQLKDGKAVEVWLNADFLAVMTQIGAMPVGK